jgi:putative component of toxin-antitoxin plasmid stabilization module
MKKLIILSIIVGLLLPFCGSREKKPRKKIKLEVSRKEEASADASKSIEEKITKKEILDESKKAATMGDMRAIGNGIVSYMIDAGKAPEVYSIEELAALLAPHYIRICPTTDAWGNQYHYKYGETGSDEYWLVSAGPDGYFEGFEIAGDDIIYNSGTFK